jgi:anhydro-N-acetylmuramic acid kinase
VKSLVVAGVMSGTSADGVDVAICRISPALRAGGTPRIKLIGHLGIAYPKTVRSAVLCAMDADAISVAELARLNWRLGEVYADAVAKAQEKFGVKVKLVGCHGQTVYHQGASEKYLGKATRATWQIGEAAVIAEKLRTPVVSDFRPGDLAAGGQGAPLVPMLDYCIGEGEQGVAESWRNWEFDGYSCGGWWGRSDGIRYGAGQYGDRCLHEEAV